MPLAKATAVVDATATIAQMRFQAQETKDGDVYGVSAVFPANCWDGITPNVDADGKIRATPLAAAGGFRGSSLPTGYAVPSGPFKGLSIGYTGYFGLSAADVTRRMAEIDKARETAQATADAR